MDVKELRKKTEEELIKLLKLSQEQVRDLRFSISAKQHKNVRDLKHVKKDVAKIKTILKEKEVLKLIKK